MTTSSGSVTNVVKLKKDFNLIVQQELKTLDGEDDAVPRLGKSQTEHVGESTELDSEFFNRFEKEHDVKISSSSKKDLLFVDYKAHNFEVRVTVDLTDVEEGEQVEEDEVEDAESEESQNNFERENDDLAERALDRFIGISVKPLNKDGPILHIVGFVRNEQDLYFNQLGIFDSSQVASFYDKSKKSFDDTNLVNFEHFSESFQDSLSNLLDQYYIDDKLARFVSIAINKHYRIIHKDFLSKLSSFF